MQNFNNLSSEKKELILEIIEKNKLEIKKIQDLFEVNSDHIYRALIVFADLEYRESIMGIKDSSLGLILNSDVYDRNTPDIVKTKLISRMNKMVWSEIKYILGLNVFHSVKVLNKVVKSVIATLNKEIEIENKPMIEYVAPSIETVEKLITEIHDAFSTKNTKEKFKKFGAIFDVTQLKSGNINLQYRSFSDLNLSDEQSDEFSASGLDFDYISALILINQLNWIEKGTIGLRCDFDLLTHGSERKKEKLSIKKQYANWLLEVLELEATVNPTR